MLLIFCADRHGHACWIIEWIEYHLLCCVLLSNGFVPFHRERYRSRHA